MRQLLRTLAVVALVGGAWSPLSRLATAAENWPQWRGPRGDSTSREADLPLHWDDTQNIVWRTELPEWGASTPCIWQDAIFLTAQRDNALLVLKLDKRSGAIEWTRPVGTGDIPRETPREEGQKFHQLHNLASPSPVTDGRTVAVHFGNGQLAAFDFAGQERWRHDLQAEHGAYTIWWGHANSPVIYQNLVISACMQDSLSDVRKRSAESYLVAHDLMSGEQKWKTLRATGAEGEQGDAYTTPLLTDVAGRTQLIVMGGNVLDAYDPRSGKQLWYLPGLVGGRTVNTPTVADQMVYATRGMRGPLLAVKLDGPPGERTTQRQVAWTTKQGTPDTCCPVVWNGLVFTVADDGVVRCYDALTGRQRWKERLKGDYKASPLVADERIYCVNTEGLCTVISAGDKFEKLAENALSDTILASPAVSDGHLFLRGKAALYCIGDKPGGGSE